MTAPGAAPAGASPRAPVPDLAVAPGRLNNLLFWLFWGTFGIAARLWFRVRVEGRPALQGACVLAPNHTSYLDPILLGAVLPRRVTFLMTEVIWRSPLMGWFYRWNKAIPVSVRNGNREALRAARSVLDQGRVLGIFPEGGISRDGGLLLGSPGAVSLVLAAGVPIVPVGIEGAHAAFPVGAWFPRPRPITIRFGEAILPDEVEALAADRKARLQAATTLIMRRIAQLNRTRAREDELIASPAAT